MDIGTGLSIAALVLTIPLGIASNLLTPKFQLWFGKTSERRRQRLIRRVENRISKLQAQLEGLRRVSDIDETVKVIESQKVSAPPEKLCTPTEKVATSLQRPIDPKRPVLELATFARTGIKMLGAQSSNDGRYSAGAQFISNGESRYPTTARNLVATFVMRSLTGQERVVKQAPWFKGIDQMHSQAPYFNSVSLGLLEEAGIVVYIFDEQNSTFHTPLIHRESGITVGEPIAFGEWQVAITVRGENASVRFTLSLKMSPKGVSVGTASLG